MRTSGFTLLAAGVMTLALSGFAMAEQHTSEADCPEDMNTEPGCQMEGAETSERGPIEGAATAPVAPEVAEGDDSKSLASPEGMEGDADAAAGTGESTGDDATEETAQDIGATGTESGTDDSTEDLVNAEDTPEGEDCPEDMDTEPGCSLEGETSERGPVEGAATAPVPTEGDTDGDVEMTDPEADPEAPEGQTEQPDATGGQDADAGDAAGGDGPFAVAYEDGGRYWTAEDTPTFHVGEDGTVDWLTYSGFRRYHSECHVCHGPDGEGSSYAPAIKNSAVNMDYYDFYDVVVNGRKHVGASDNSVMPAFGDNANVMCYLDDIYVYLAARGEGIVPRGRPGSREEKSEAIREAENACLG